MAIVNVNGVEVLTEPKKDIMNAQHVEREAQALRDAIHQISLNIAQEITRKRLIDTCCNGPYIPRPTYPIFYPSCGCPFDEP